MQERKVAPNLRRQLTSDREIIRFARNVDSVRIVPLLEIVLEVEERFKTVDRIKNGKVRDVTAAAQQQLNAVMGQQLAQYTPSQEVKDAQQRLNSYTQTANPGAYTPSAAVQAAQEKMIGLNTQSAPEYTGDARVDKLLGDLDALEGEPFTVEAENGAYFVSGREMERLMESVNFDNEESLNYFHRSLRRLGVIDALREKGAKEGDSVVIGGMEFDFVE